MTTQSTHLGVRGPVALTDVLPASLVLSTLRAFKRGDFEVSLPLEYTGVAGEIAEELNAVIDLNRRLATELARVSNVVGKEGKLTQRASLGDVQGSFASCIGAVNDLISDLVQPTTEVGRVIGAVPSGDLSQK